MTRMKKAVVAAAGALVAVSASTMIGGAQGRPAAPARAAVARAAPDAVFLKRYCLGCHNQRTKVGNLALDALGLGDGGRRRGRLGEGRSQAAHRDDAARGRAEAGRRRAREGLSAPSRGRSIAWPRRILTRARRRFID